MNTTQQQQNTDDQQQGNGWRPQNAGDRVEGTVANLTRGWSDPQKCYYPIVTLNTAAGPVDVHCFHSVLREELAEVRPKLGDRLAITYKGQRAHKKDANRTVTDYDVEAPDREVDAAAFWSGVAGRDDRAPDRAQAAPAPSDGAPEADVPW